MGAGFVSTITRTARSTTVSVSILGDRQGHAKTMPRVPNADTGAVNNRPTAPSLAFLPCPRDRSWSRDWVPLDSSFQPTQVEKLTQSDFIFRNFTVDTTFTIGSADFSDRAGFVCVLDLVLMLQSARVMLRKDKHTVLELSDRQGEWRFTQYNGLVSVRTRYATREGWRFHSDEGHCRVSDFDHLVDQALTDALTLIFSMQPVTRRNPYLQGLARNGFEAA